MRTLPMIYIMSRIHKSDVRKSHIPDLIKNGVRICMGVMQNQLRAESGSRDMFKHVTINAEIVLREISCCNNKLGDQKLTAFQLFGHFLANFRDEPVKAFFSHQFRPYTNFADTFASALALSFTFALEFLNTRYNEGKFTTPEEQDLYERIRQLTVDDFMYSEVQKLGLKKLNGTTSKFDVTKDHIQALIKAGVTTFVGVMKNKLRNDLSFDVFKQVHMHADVILREILTQNNNLGDQKFTVFELCRYFLADLLKEVFNVFLDTNFARYIKRGFTKPPISATGVFGFVAIYVAYTTFKERVYSI